MMSYDDKRNDDKKNDCYLLFEREPYDKKRGSEPTRG